MPHRDAPAPAAHASALRAALPNALTAGRVVLAVAFIAVLATTAAPTSAQHPVWEYLAAAALFVVAAVTDALDGFLARRWNVISRFGRVMDPFADKVLVIGAFVMLSGPAFSTSDPHVVGLRGSIQISGVLPWMSVVIIARELLVTSLRGMLESDGIDFSATWPGKWKMIVQSVAVPLVLLVLALAPSPPSPTPLPPPAGPGTTARTVILATVWTTLVVTVLSGVPYVARAIVLLRTPHAGRPARTSVSPSRSG